MHQEKVHLGSTLLATAAGRMLRHATFSTPVEDENFYRDLPEFSNFSDVCDLGKYHEVPDTWDLVITDVEGSTKAIEGGRYKEVNAAGVAAIVVLRNCIKDVDIPFVFGGDGATLLTPRSRRDRVSAALRGLRDRCRAAYGLSMRVGIVPMSKLLEEGQSVGLARFAASPNVSFAMLRGEGVDIGERWVKDPGRSEKFHVSEEGAVYANFEGFECRWRAIPSKHGLVASIIVKALAATELERHQTYGYVLGEIGAMVENTNQGRPLEKRSLRMLPGRHDFSDEAILKTGSTTSSEAKEVLSGIHKQLRVGKILFATGISAGGFRPNAYKNELLANTDFRKFDNALRMHLDLRRGQLERLREVLQGGEDEGHLAYGIHTARESLMTCVIDSYKGSHAHFVDGAAGGYALAAKRLKAVMRDR